MERCFCLLMFMLSLFLFVVEEVRADANDNFVDAQVLTVTSGSANYSSIGKTREVGELINVGADVTRETVWFKVSIGNTSGNLTFSKTYFQSIAYSVYTGTALNNLVNVANGTDSVSYAVQANTTYYVQVFTLNNEQGTIYSGYSVPSIGQEIIPTSTPSASPSPSPTPTGTSTVSPTPAPTGMLTASMSGVIYGRVIDKTLNPFSGVMVEYSSVDNNYQGVNPVLTDSDGYYYFEDCNTLYGFDLTMSKKRFGTVTVSYQGTSTASVVKVPDQLLSKGNSNKFTLSGTVKDIFDTPVDFARVRVKSVGIMQVCYSGLDGGYSFSGLVVGTYTVTARKAGFYKSIVRYYNGSGEDGVLDLLIKEK